MEKQIQKKVKDILLKDNKLLSITKDQNVEKAITLMMLNDYSQLPVIDKRTCFGIISWKTIAMKKQFNGQATIVNDCYDKKFEQISEDEKLMDVIPMILRSEFVLVKNDKKEYIGIITMEDITRQYTNIAEPFFLLEEIEMHLRKLIVTYFPGDINELIKMHENGRIIESVDFLTFGQYIEILSNNQNWELMAIPLDRKEINNALMQINSIRNQVMHFRTEAISDKDLNILRNFAKVLRTLFKLGNIIDQDIAVS